MNSQSNAGSATHDFGPLADEHRDEKRSAGFSLRLVFTGILVLVGYYLGARLGLALTFAPHPVSVMWPPNAILLAALLLTPSRWWWFMVLAALPAHLAAEWQSGVPLPMILCWFVSNSCEALIGAIATRWIIGFPLRFDRLRDVSVLFLCGALVGPFLSSFLDAAFVTLNQWGNRDYWEVWSMRLFSNVFTALTVMPVIVIWGTHRWTKVRFQPTRRWLEALVICAGLLVVSTLVFYRPESSPATAPMLLYVPLPFLLWAAVRFGLVGASTTIFLMALLAIWGSIHGGGPFAGSSPERDARSIQVFFTVISVMLLLLAACIEERRTAEERFTKVFFAGPEAMIISRLKDGHIIEINERCEKMFGRPRGEIISRMMFDLSAAPPNGGHGLHELELSLRSNAGELRHTQVSAVIDDLGGERCFIILLRDITDRKRAEEAQQNLAHASRLAVVGELTAMIAHEVNQPLGAILSNAEAAEILLDSENPPLDEIRQILADIRKDDQRADEAIRRIRTLLRKRDMQLQPLDLNETISDGLRLVAGDALRRHIRVRRDLSAKLPPVFGDRVHLQQVLLNLVVNGMDAMNDTPELERQITVRTKPGKVGEIEVSVIDYGQGISPEKLPRLFDSFYTTKKDGMGLGLSIARSIIEAHHGRLWVENNPVCGAAFRFTVPVAKL